MKFSRLLANIATALVLTLLVMLCLFAHLSTLVVPERREAMAQVDFAPGEHNKISDRRLP